MKKLGMTSYPSVTSSRRRFTPCSAAARLGLFGNAVAVQEQVQIELQEVPGVREQLRDALAPEGIASLVVFAVGDVEGLATAFAPARQAFIEIEVVDFLPVGEFAQGGDVFVAQQVVDHRLEHDFEVLGQQVFLPSRHDLRLVRPVEEGEAKLPERNVPVREVLVFDSLEPPCPVAPEIPLELRPRDEFVAHVDFDRKPVARLDVVEDRIEQDEQFLVEVDCPLLAARVQVERTPRLDGRLGFRDGPGPVGLVPAGVLLLGLEKKVVV